ncbi:MAG TPA: hypothetical protein VK762_09710 [Polyangiaceae bacterium]|jgi:hypothetical protein|nr:hypothetical protein [Polyangiaceae bacterium]
MSASAVGRASARWLGLAWLALGAALAGCAATPYDGSTAAPAERSIAAIHASKCGACHSPPNPRTRSREYLEDALSRHRKRVHLSRDEWAEMTDYLAIPEGKTARQP